MKTLTATLTLVILTSILNISTSSANHLKKGSKLFNLELNDFQKKDVEIMNFVAGNKYTVITFFADYCSPCIRELDSINKKYLHWKNNFNTGFVSICVSNDQNINRIKERTENNNWSFPVLLDNRGEAMNILRIAHIPYTIIVDENGKIVYQQDGYSVENISNIEKIISEGVSIEAVAIK